jgi:GNAT superfamily N-acetyltransferase
MPQRPAPLWYARHHVPGQPGSVVVGVAGGEFPEGSVVDLPTPARRPAGWVTEAHVAGPGALPHRVLVSDLVAPAAPLLWYFAVPAPDVPAGIDLVAFSTTDQAEGDVLDAPAFDALGLAWGNQVGAIRWDAGTGLISQVYVAPTVRRRGVGTKLVAAAAGLTHGRNWPELHADGRRTDLGEAWVSGVRAAAWLEVAPRTGTAPPMTPPADAVGVPTRNLVPDGATPAG